MFPQYRESIYENVFDEADLLSYATREPTNSNQVKIIRDETTPWGSTGVQANWRAEGTQMSASKMADKEMSVDLHELYAFVLATDDLLNDAPRLSGRLAMQAARAINWKASDAIMNGTGSGQPDGFFGHSSEVVVAKESGQSADTINATNVAKMMARCLNPTNAIWIAHQSILPQLVTMTIGNQPIWTAPDRGMQDAPGGFLLGRPVIYSNHAKTLGDKGDLQLLDLDGGYYVAEKSTGISFAESMHLFFDYGMQAFRWTFRMGGRPFASDPVTPANGSDTLSHFVQLAERA
jgi:HK97 family phage major capsid protein